MNPVVSYLFARSADALPGLWAPAPVQVRPGDPPSAALTVLLAQNGLFVRVATPTVQALLPLVDIPAGRVRGLAPCAPALLAAADAPTPTTALAPLAYGVSRGAGRLLPVSLGYGAAAEPGWPLTYVVAANGVFTSHVTPLYAALIRVCPLPVAVGDRLGLGALDEGIALRVPRIPAHLLYTCAVEAARIAETSGREALWDFRWDAATGWSVDRPAQDTSASHVSAAPISDPRILLTLHSHGRHRTYWSGTDDRDEQRCGLNAVLGDLGDGLRSARLLVRVSVFGYFLRIPAATLFDGALPVAEGPAPRGQTPPWPRPASTWPRGDSAAPASTATVERLVDEALALERAFDRAIERVAAPTLVGQLGAALAARWERLGEQGAAADVYRRTARAAADARLPDDGPSPHLGAADGPGTPGTPDPGGVPYPGRRPAHAPGHRTMHSERRQRGGLAGLLGLLRRDDR